MKYLQSFFNKDSSGGVILIISAIIAMLLSNLKETQDLYHAFLEAPVECKIGTLEIKKNVSFLINDALMTIFFLLIGLEVKRELIIGSLSGYQRAIFPIVAAIGGMVIPSLIYLIFNFWDPVTRIGWAIPMATDIAFALGILSLLGNRVPAALKIFLMALSIVDDIGAIIIIALFYSTKLSLISLWFSILIIFILLVLNACNVRRIGIYLSIGAFLWISILESGIHSTLSGVVIGTLIPLKEEKKNPTIKTLEHILHPWINFLILPLFAFANAGVTLKSIEIYNLISTLTLGIAVGLFIGKPIGISLFCWLALKLKLSNLPQGISYKEIMISSTLCGVGFTMSIFISTLAFFSKSTDFIIFSKLGILLGSMLSAILGYILLKLKLPKSMEVSNRKV